MCVSENNCDCGAEKVRVGVCICTLRSDSHPPIVNSKNGLFATSRPELVFFLVFKKSAGTSDVGYCDCRQVCDDEESHP